VAAGGFPPSCVMLALAEPWFRRLRAWPRFDDLTRAQVQSFVGRLASAARQPARLAPWSAVGVLPAVAAFLLLQRKVDVAWIVLGGGLLSALLV